MYFHRSETIGTSACMGLPFSEEVARFVLNSPLSQPYDCLLAHAQYLNSVSFNPYFSNQEYYYTLFSGEVK